MEFKKFFRKIGILEDDRPIGRYSIHLLSLPEELDHEELVPLEIKYVFQRDPKTKMQVRKLLENEHLSLGVRTTKRTPERVVNAINNVSHYSQHLTTTTWLPDLIEKGKKPLITDADRKEAKKHGVKDLDEEVEVIYSYRDEFRKIILLDSKHDAASASQLQLIKHMNEVLMPMTLKSASKSMVFDAAHTRTEIAQAIIKALIVVGPITHFLEKFATGWGKVFAASIDDLMTETAEFFALRGAGFSWKQIWKRAFVLVPVFVLATWGLLSVEHFIEEGRYAVAGVLFGLGAVALSLTTAVQSIFMFHARVKELEEEKKMKFKKRSELWKVALVQDFTNPARLGLFVGAIASPILAAIVFSGAVYTNNIWILYNGWILALLGSTETIIAGITIIYARKISEMRFRKQLTRMIRK
jgi:hypothetical protein